MNRHERRKLAAISKYEALSASFHKAQVGYDERNYDNEISQSQHNSPGVTGARITLTNLDGSDGFDHT